MEGSTSDKSGKVKYLISGSWQDKVIIKNKITGSEQCIWEREEAIENQVRQYGFRKVSILLNYLSDEMK